MFLLCPLFFFGQHWEPDYKTAQERASTENRPLVVVFSGSDWCAPCIRLDRKIWQSPEFADYAKNHLVLYRADFPRKKKNQLSTSTTTQNKKLAEAYNPKGYFPLIVVLNAREKVLGNMGFEPQWTPQNYISNFKSLLP